MGEVKIPIQEGDGMEGANRHLGGLSAALPVVCALLLWVSGCFEAQVKPGAVVGVQSGAVQLLPRLEKVEAKVQAQGNEIAALSVKVETSVHTGNITTGGTTHMLVLCIATALIFAFVLLTVLTSAVRILTASLGRTEATGDARSYVKAHTHLTPLAHPVRWLAGKMVDLAAKSQGVHKSAKEAERA